MKAEAELNAESDRKEKERVDALNKADNMIFQTEKQIKEFGDKISEFDKSELQSIVNELKEIHKSGNVDRIDPTINKLNETWNRISTDLYSKSNEPDKDNKSEPDTQDVSYEEVN